MHGAGRRSIACPRGRWHDRRSHGHRQPAGAFPAVIRAGVGPLRLVQRGVRPIAVLTYPFDHVNAVVHAHPPVATAFAVAGIPLDRAVLAEVVTTLGSVPIAEYATPSTKELPDAVRKYVKAHDGMLLANHGALTLGADLFSAYYKMETIEHFAKISLVARLLGREHLISRDEVERRAGAVGRGARACRRRISCWA